MAKPATSPFPPENLLAQTGNRAVEYLRWTDFSGSINSQVSGYIGENFHNDPFSIILLPDTQHYSDLYPSTFTAQTTYAVNQQTTDLNAKLVIHLGDIVDDRTDTSQWTNADTSMTVLDTANMPYCYLPGNHDGSPSDLTAFNTYFPTSRVSGKDWYQGGTYDSTHAYNYLLQTISGIDFVFVNLGASPPSGARTWASGIFSTYSDRIGILSTHNYLDVDSTRTTVGDDIWNDVVKNNSNVRAVLCGHMHGEGQRVDLNNDGFPVYQILQDYQDEANGGNGWLRILTFHSHYNQTDIRFYVKTYSVTLDEWGTDLGPYHLDYDTFSTGSSGVSGYSGVSGWSGYSGISGTGVSGYSGVSGSPGISGFSGTSGYSGTGSLLEIQDEGVSVDASVDTINFVGSDVIAVIDAIDSDKVHVYIPTPNLVSHFNTSDGDGDCTLSDKSTTSRRISAPTLEGTPFNIGDWSGDDLRDTIRASASSFSYTTTNPCSFLNLTTTIEVNIYDADGVSTLASHTTSAITGNTNVTSDNITIQVTSWAADAYKFKGIISVSFDISTILTANGFTSGRFSVEIIHHNSTDGDFSYTQNDIFYDSESQTQTIGNVTISETTPSIIQKSGVYAYDTGSTFTIAIDDLDYLNADSYPTNFVVLAGTEYGLPSYNITGSDGDLSGWTSAFDNTNATFSKSNWTINQSNYYIRTTTANVSAQVIDWSAGASDDSPNSSIIVDTYNDNSTRVYEDFRGESERLEDDLSTPWDNTASLASADDGQGLQVGEGTYLYYPTLNNTGYNPSSGSQPDYSALSGDRYYYRGMWHTSTAHSNGQFNMTGVTEQNITDDDIIIEISLNGSDWYNCNEDYLGGALSNGDGCRVNSGSTVMPNLDFTLGTGGFTASGTGPGWGIWIKITMPDTSTVKMNLLQITNWT